MSPTNRIRLSAPEAAAHLKCSVSALYRKAQTEPGFPKPHKSHDKHRSNGKPRSFWYKDELDTFSEKQEPRNVSRRQMLDLARRCADRGTGNAGFPHPAVRAFLLAGGDLPTLALETDLPEGGLRQLYELTELEDDVLLSIYGKAIAQALCQERTLRGCIENDLSVAGGDSFHKALRDLDEAHRVLFGQSLKAYLTKEGRDDGIA